MPMSTWGKPFFKALSRPAPSGQWLWLWLVAGPQTGVIPGLLHAGEAAMAESLGWPLSKFRRAFQELEAQDLARADWSAPIVWVPSIFEDYPPESPNVLKAWRTAFDELPECALAAAARARAEGLVEGLPESFREAFAKGSRKTFGKTLPNKEQEKEQITGTEGSPLPPSLARPPAGRSGRPSSKRVSEAWRGSRA
ncbi:MAG TPA: hypothetical protein VL086_09150 [Candidatus Nitrosotalea sp.]|nr:hypothetical protein [Candidatus Nitrosotalea sp.]